MSSAELAEYFINHSPDFDDDLDLADLDDKHTNILNNSYRQIKGGMAFSEKNFRNWKDQGDMSVPAQLSLNNIRSNGLLYSLAEYG